MKLTAFALSAAVGISAAVTLYAQAAEKTVADGVFTDAQAVRGATSYTANCSGCHRPDLGGAKGPPLKEQRFSTDYAGKDLNVLFAKIAKTMPRQAPATLGDDVYLDIVAHILQENGFQPGKDALTAEALPGIRIVPGRPKPPPPLGDFSYMETVGCLTRSADGEWLLTNAAEPKTVALPVAADSAAKAAGTPAAAQTFHLLDAMAYNPDTHKGQKMYVRGLLIKLPGEQRITISALETMAPTCEATPR